MADIWGGRDSVVENGAESVDFVGFLNSINPLLDHQDALGILKVG